MASSKKAIVERLTEIKEEASEMAKNAPDYFDSDHIDTARDACNLAEEAAGLGLELAAKPKSQS